MRIGVGISTHNRGETARRSLQHWRKHLPPGAELVVVDDASDEPFDEATYRFERNAGIPRVKNKCIELLVDRGCDELFLADDDCWPLTPEWWKPYVESPEPHLMRIFKDLSGRNKLNDITEVYRDAQHVAYSGSRGMFLYANARVLDVVGGMNPEYGRWGWEHPDWSCRIYNAGLTSWRYADVTNSDQLIYSLDEHEAVDRSVDRSTRRAVAQDNASRFYSYFKSKTYVPYRDLPDTVVTTLLTASQDPQRGYTWKPDPECLRTLVESLDGHPLTVLHDEIPDSQVPDWQGVTFVRVPTGINPYFQRWYSIYRWLRNTSNVDHVWCVDGTDVTLLRPPWHHMRADTVYVGSEPMTVGTRWLRDHHRAEIVQRTIRENTDSVLMNAGLVGASRPLLLEFIHDMLALYEDNARLRFLGKETSSLGVGDMGALQVLCYGPRWRSRVTYGDHVNTTFKSFKDNGVAWWMHK